MRNPCKKFQKPGMVIQTFWYAKLITHLSTYFNNRTYFNKENKKKQQFDHILGKKGSLGSYPRPYNKADRNKNNSEQNN